MSGSRLGRGRVGRLALLGCGALGLVFLVYVYRSASTEMAGLRDLHVKCAQQQEALAAQLQVLYEYKVQLEKTLSNEKSANAAAKEELQQKATRERSLRDKDSLEAMQRFNSLQQNYKLLQTEHQDLKDDCRKKEDVALDNAKGLESRLKELRVQLQEAKVQMKQLAEDRDKAMERLKNKYQELLQEKEIVEEKYGNLMKANGENSGDVDRLQKQLIQLQRELDEAKKSQHFSVGGLNVESSQVLPRHANDVDNNNVPENDKVAVLDSNRMQVMRSSSQQQQQAGISSSRLSGVGPAQPVSESSSKPSISNNNNNNNKAATKVKLPLGVPPIPRLPEPKPEDEKKESAGQAPSPLKSAVEVPVAEPELLAKAQKSLDETAGNDEVEAQPLQQQQQQQQPPRHVGEQILDRHEADSWYKLKLGVQEVGDPHHIDKNGFENAGGNEDVEQYDDYNYKEPQNKNGDLHLEEGEDEREDEDDYMHNINPVKHE